MDFTDRDVAECRRWAAFYGRAGFQPLPSDPARKRPLIRYADLWESPAPADLFGRFATPNLQVMTGRFWGLVVFDLDGPEAVEAWRSLVPHAPRTWVSHSGGGGRHAWYRVDPSGPPLPYATVWRPDPSAPRAKGEPAVERLGDRRLVMAPPSVHPVTGRRYVWRSRAESPYTLPRPAWCPPAALALPPVFARPRPAGLATPPAPAQDVPLLALQRGRYSAAEVRDAVPDKLAVAESWGLRVASRAPNASGWVRCHALGREDRNPSASFHAGSGVYWEASAGSCGFFTLAERLGAYPDWSDAVEDLGERYLGRRARRGPAA